MPEKYTIGQMSELNNIPIKTLRYYDEIGLFTPHEVDPQTGYRYYSVEQFKRLDMITFLKSIGVPLKEIKKKVEHSTVSEFVEILTAYKQKNEQKVEELQRINTILEQKINDIGNSRSSITKHPVIQTFPERRIVKVGGTFHSLEDIEEVLRELKKDHIPVMVGTVGFTVSLEQVMEDELEGYDGIFVTVDEPSVIGHYQHTIMSEGDYAMAYLGVEETREAVSYQHFLECVADMGYEPEGPFFIRTIVESFISHNEQEHIREIQIRVTPKH